MVIIFDEGVYHAEQHVFTFIVMAVRKLPAQMVFCFPDAGYFCKHVVNGTKVPFIDGVFFLLLVLADNGPAAVYDSFIVYFAATAFSQNRRRFIYGIAGNPLTVNLAENEVHSFIS